MLGVAEVDQCIEARHSLEHDVAALAPITTVRTSELDELFATKAHCARAAGSGTDEDFRLVEEMHARELGDAGGQGNL